jgi:alpha-beta hydrolase superfamily lysophospholipase
LKHTDTYLDVTHSEARGSSRLYQQTWEPDDQALAVVLLVHGLGEYSGRYAHVAEHLTSRGFVVCALDHYGHGKSDGHAGFVERFSVYLDGVDALRSKMQAEYPSLPLFLIGHSMGGLIAAACLLASQDAFRACVLSGPALKTDQAPPALLLALNRLLSAVVPTLPMIQLDASGVSRDPAVVEAYVNDPLVFHGKLTARLIAELSKTMDDTLSRAAEIRIPVIFMHGEEDQLTSPSGSQEMFANVSSADKTLRLYPGLYHEIFNEPEQEAVLADMSTWLERHL